ncbi:DBH-like monooxygenase protein 1 homolog isoform X1 [Hypanus sabinus]|uniref:DBH-like monooxygenase protein 1 homolog isoform X1 n=2 Tax=Hypanus sabinus TaxID=79690 RepID=UPI0028C44D57|nr:DBH-like monooxygenase protein 1 homolog isoform X1 [Hypanus sabinus]
MVSSCLWCLVLVAALLLKLCPGAAAATAGTWARRTFAHHAVLDANGRYHLRWKGDNTSITFEVEVETRGYVGFGISPTGSMAQSDMVIGGVANGRPYLKDYNTLNLDGKLNKDYRQDYRLEYGMENSTHTVIAFSRDLNTCDYQDKIITDNTVRVIWAYHPNDVGQDGPQYHSSNRGRKSLHLLNPKMDSSIPSDVLTFNIRHLNVSIPNKDTTYWCQIFKLPNLAKKHHVIRVEPIIQKGHEHLVHHILLYQCHSSLNDSALDIGHECYHSNMPDDFLHCESIIVAWAIGGKGFSFPPNVGLSLGTPGDPTYVMMEVHYDNPSFQEGYVDSSGLKLIYTPVLRKNDAGIIETGVWVSLYHMIPPAMSSYLSQGHCSMECLHEALSQEKASGIHVFAVLLHSHLAGRALRIRHFRNSVEQPLLAYDHEFDFNFQEFRYLKEERVLLPGDSLVTECQYNTKSRKNMTWGGLSTRDEMCLSYLLYYPKIDLSRCESLPEIAPQLKFIGVKEIYRPVMTWPFIIKSPKKYKDLSFTEAMNKFRWSGKKGREFNNLVNGIEMNIRCAKHDQREWQVNGIPILPPAIKPWEPKMEQQLPCRTTCQCYHPLLVLMSLALCAVLTAGM